MAEIVWFLSTLKETCSTVTVSFLPLTTDREFLKRVAQKKRKKEEREREKERKMEGEPIRDVKRNGKEEKGQGLL